MPCSYLPMPCCCLLIIAHVLILFNEHYCVGLLIEDISMQAFQFFQFITNNAFPFKQNLIDFWKQTIVLLLFIEFCFSLLHFLDCFSWFRRLKHIRVIELSVNENVIKALDLAWAENYLPISDIFTGGIPEFRKQHILLFFLILRLISAKVKVNQCPKHLQWLIISVFLVD